MLNFLKSTVLSRRVAGLMGGLFAAVCAVQSAQAGTFTFATPTGSTTKGGAVNAQAVMTVNNGSISVTLTNLKSNPTADSQLISAVRFNVSGATGVASLTNSSGPVSTINIVNNTYSTAVTQSLTHWSQTSNSVGVVNLDTLSGQQPNQLIIGPDSAGGYTHAGFYSNANNSISTHNPVVLGSATFTISVAGVTQDSVISRVSFQFGTTDDEEDNTVSGRLSNPVPEPGSLAVWGVMALVGVGYARRRHVA